MLDRCDGVARIDEAALGGGFRHELRDALGAGRACRRAAKPAFGPQQPGEKADRQTVRRRRVGDRLADQLPVVGRRPGAPPPAPAHRQQEDLAQDGSHRQPVELLAVPENSAVFSAAEQPAAMRLKAFQNT